MIEFNLLSMLNYKKRQLYDSIILFTIKHFILIYAYVSKIVATSSTLYYNSVKVIVMPLCEAQIAYANGELGKLYLLLCW